jgi:Carboxypeptidase regulatory-like domain
MRRLAALGLAVLLYALPVCAQEQSGSILGVVKDSSGAVLPGVTVEARSPSLVGVQIATSEVDGSYRFPALPPGTYEVTAKLQGFADKRLPDVQLALGQVLKIDLPMAVGGLAETVTITAESPLIDVKQNAAAATISKEVIDRIPKGRDWTSVIATAPGANNESRAGGF